MTYNIWMTIAKRETVSDVATSAAKA